VEKTYFDNLIVPINPTFKELCKLAGGKCLPHCPHVDIMAHKSSMGRKL